MTATMQARSLAGGKLMAAPLLLPKETM